MFLCIKEAIHVLQFIFSRGTALVVVIVIDTIGNKTLTDF